VLDPEDAEVHYQLGSTYLKINKEEEAVDQFKQVVRLEPNHLSAHYNLAQALLQLERIEESKKEMATFHRLSLQEDEIKKLQRLIPVQPKNPDLNRKLGEIYFNRNEFKAAVEQFEKVLELNPQEVGTLELLERAKIKIRKNQKLN